MPLLTAATGFALGLVRPDEEVLMLRDFSKQLYENNKRICRGLQWQSYHA